MLDLREVIADEHLRARGFVVADTHPVADRPVDAGRRVAVRRRAAGPRPPHRLGDDTREVLGELAGLQDRDVETLEIDGVLV